MTGAPAPSDSATDLLKWSLPLQNQLVLFPYGLPLLVKSNDVAPIRVAENSWGSCRVLYHEQPIELRILVTDAPQRRRPAEPATRGQGNLMAIVADAYNYACCDLSRGLAFAVLSRAGVRQREYLRNYFIEALTYKLLDALHLVMFRASSVSFRDRGFIFVGDSGAGKSSLAYACARRGWTLISDDATAVVRRRRSRSVIGHPRTFRFWPNAADLFPEISGAVKSRNRKPTIEIRIDSIRGIQTAQSCNVHFALFLKYSPNSNCEADVFPMLKEDALRRLCYQAFPQELGIDEERFRAIESLLFEARTFEFVYRDPEAAISFLERLVEGDA